MVPFHLFLFAFFKKADKEMSMSDYHQSQLSKKIQERSKDIQYNMRHYL
ncbi:hypothetical protein [Bacillus pinisoli]|nr:hypothetical protein [Bacillus pinisoli]